MTPVPVLRARALRLAALILALSGLVVGACGCWGAKDIGMRGFVLMIGIDSQGDGVRVSAQVSVNERMGDGDGGGGGGQAFSVIHHDSGSVAEAINLLQDAAALQLYFGHLKIVVVGEEYASRRGIVEAVDTLLREPEVRGQVVVAGAAGRAEDLVRAKIEGERLPATFIERLLMTGREFGHVPESHLAKVAACLDTEGCHVIIPILKAEEGKIEIGGGLVFRGEKAVGTLEHLAIHNRSVITGARAVGLYSIPSPRGQGRIYVLLRRPASAVRVREEGGGVSIDVAIHAEGEVVEDSGHTGGAQGAQRARLGAVVDQLNEQVSAEVERQVSELVSRVQREFGVDIFGFAKHSGRLKFEDGKWDQLFPRAKVNVRADVRLRRFGLGAA